MGFEEWTMVARGTARRNRRRRRRMSSFVPVAVFHIRVDSLIVVFGIYNLELIEPRRTREG